MKDISTGSKKAKYSDDSYYVDKKRNIKEDFIYY